MKIRIDSPTAAERIQKELDKVQHRCTARTIDAAELLGSARSVASRFPCSSRALDGTRAEVDPNAQEFPNAYRYTPHSTHFHMVNHGGKWSITGIFRFQCRRPNSAVSVWLSDAAKREIIAYYEQSAL